MKYLLTTSCILLFNIIYGQIGHEAILASNALDSVEYKYYLENVTGHALPSLKESSLNEHTRLWVSNQIIEIWRDSVYTGKITSYAYESIADNNEPPTNRIYSITESLDSLTSKKIIDAVNLANISNLPSDYDSNNIWNCADCNTYTIETLINNSYRFNAYLAPDLFSKQFPNAKIVDDLFNNILLLTNAEYQQEKLSNNIPFETFTFGGNVIGRKILSKKEKRKYRNERNRYRSSVGISNKLKVEKN